MTQTDFVRALARTGLSRRQCEVLWCLLQGQSQKETALSLNISSHTVHVYIKTIHRRFKVSSRGELLSYWLLRVVAAHPPDLALDGEVLPVDIAGSYPLL